MYGKLSNNRSQDGGSDSFGESSGHDTHRSGGHCDGGGDDKWPPADGDGGFDEGDGDDFPAEESKPKKRKAKLGK